MEILDYIALFNFARIKRVLYVFTYGMNKSENSLIKVYIMRMSHEIFNMEWSNRDRLPAYSGRCSSIRLSPDRLKDF